MASEAATREEPPDPMIGKVLDERYRIEEPLGQGGIGRVYKARHLILGRIVALKVLLAQYESIPVLKERFKRESEFLAALSHPNIVAVNDYGVEDAMPYLVMELLEGEDLACLIERSPIDPRRGLAIVRQVLRALAYAHSRDLVHRDLKPHNVFVRALGDGTDHVHVLDFGLARFVGEAANRGPKLTRAGALIGTPAYMAPEQASGEAVDARADVYATGIVLFETLTGRKPFESRDPGEMLRAHLLSAPPTLAQADPGLQVASGLEALVARALAKKPHDRHPGAAEMLAALDALGPEPVRRVGPRPPRDQPIRTVDATQAGAAVTRAATPGALASRRPESSIALPQSKLPLLAAGGCLAGLLVGGLLVLGLLFGDAFFDAPEQTPPTVQPSATEAPQTAPVPVEEPATLAVPLEPELASAHRNIHEGRIEARDRELLERHRDLRPNDAAPALLLAHWHVANGDDPSAVAAYEEAHRRDARVVGDPQMLGDLLRMARTSGRQREAAADLVVGAYGRRALDAIDAQIEELGRGPQRAERQRLEILRNRIEQHDRRGTR